MAKKGFSVNQELTASKAKSKPKKWSFYYFILSYFILSYSHQQFIQKHNKYSHLSAYLSTYIRRLLTWN